MMKGEMKERVHAIVSGNNATLTLNESTSIPVSFPPVIFLITRTLAHIFNSFLPSSLDLAQVQSSPFASTVPPPRWKHPPRSEELRAL